jgi:hypothetical protein
MAQRYLFLKIEFGAVYVDFRGVPNVRYVTVYKINIYADLSGCRTGPKTYDYFQHFCGGV